MLFSKEKIDDAIELKYWKFLGRKDVDLTPEQIEKMLPLIKEEDIVDSLSNKSAHIFNKMTLEQFKRIEHPISPKYMVRTKGFTIEEYINVTNEARRKLDSYSILLGRFWTEEEILAHPEMFDPRVFRKSSMLFVTKPTMTALNKYWKTRFRVKEGFTELSSILSGRDWNDFQTTLDDFIYLVHKTNSTNTNVLQTLQHRSTKHKIGRGLDSLLPIINLLKD